MTDHDRYTFAQMLSLAARERWGIPLEICPHCGNGAVCEHEDDADGNEGLGVMCCSWCDEVWNVAV